MTPEPATLPTPLAHPVVDNHAHLDHRRGQDPTDEVPVDDMVAAALAQAAEVGVPRVIQIGCELPSARWTVQAVQRHPGLLGGVALHPTEATKIFHEAGAGGLQQSLGEIERLARTERIRVVGETGLDHYWVPADDVAGRRAQETSFRWHIDLAKRTGRVLQIHDREAHDDVVRILLDEGAPEGTVLHCFSGDARLARFCVDQGWYLSFAGTVTFKNADGLREALVAVPLEQVLVETDAPYLAPVPYRGRANSPALLPFTVRAVAEATGRDVDDVCRLIDSTSEALYGPW
jgi:TatD DNase family protein